MAAHAEVTVKALRKITAAVEGIGHKAVVIGPLAYQAWGSTCEAKDVDLLVSSGAAQRDSILSAARGEGLQQVPPAAAAAPNAPTVRLQYVDAKVGASANIGLVEASTAYHRQVIGRAQPGIILDVRHLLATCEDLIVLLAGSSQPADRKTIIELLRGNAGQIDAPYLKREAEAGGVFAQLKSAWQEARQA